MKIWWLTDLARLATELEAVDGAVAEGWFALTRWCLDEERLAAEGVITAHGAEYPVRLLYPDQFPAVPGWVEPQDPDAHWSGHQYGKGGVLCLELRPDNWHSSATGGDLLRSAYNLLRTENPLGTGTQDAVPSAHHAGAVQAYDMGTIPVLIGLGCLGRIQDGTATAVRAIRWPLANDVWPILVYDAVDAESDARPPDPESIPGLLEISVCVARADLPDSIPATRSAFGEMLGVDLGPESFPGALLVLVVSDTAVVPYHSWDAETVYVRKLVPFRDDVGVRSGYVPPASTKPVAIIGLGSVGSKIAESLVRAGRTWFVLVDGDVMLPGNLERHSLDWRDVGFRKVHGVKRRLLGIRPGADVFVVAENLNWQRSAQRHALIMDLLARSELIVDATGDVPTSLFLGAIAAENNKPFVSVEVLEGGIGCIVARSVPGRDGTYAEGRAGLLAYCEQQAVAPPAGGARAYEAIAEDGTVLVADDAAVSVAAAHASRVALDVLHNTLDEEAPAWMLVGLQRKWIFSGHGSTIGLHVPPAPEAPREGIPLHPEQEERARALVLELVKEATREAAPSE